MYPPFLPPFPPFPRLQRNSDKTKKKNKHTKNNELTKESVILADGFSSVSVSRNMHIDTG